MAATRVQAAFAKSTLSTAYASNVTSGNLLVAIFRWTGGSGVTLTGVTDSLSNIWTLHASTHGFSSGTTEHIQIASCTTSSSGANTVTGTLSSGASFKTIGIEEYNNAAGSMVFDAGNAALGTSTTPDSGNVTTATANELAVGTISSAYVDPTASPRAPSGGFTQGASYMTYWNGADCYKLDLGAAGTYSAAWGMNGASSTWLMNIATFKVASTGITLTGSNSTEVNTSSAASITQVHVLAGDSVSQANTSSTAGITQTHFLTSDASTEANVSIAAAVTQTHVLAGANSSQANASSIGAITQTQVLTVSTSAQNGTSSAVAITQIHVLSGPAATQGNLGSTGAISVISEFIGAPSTQGNISSTGQITRTQTLTGASSTQVNLSGTCVISDGIVVEASLTTGITSTIRIKKPGIPAGTPEWLKTMLEIIIGRRGNAIEVPKFQTLTFSATPTKTECEALYSYTNTVRDSLEQLINRMDS